MWHHTTIGRHLGMDCGRGHRDEYDCSMQMSEHSARGE